MVSAVAREEKTKLLFPFLGPKQKRFKVRLSPLSRPLVSFPTIQGLELMDEQLLSRAILEMVQMRSWWPCKKFAPVLWEACCSVQGSNQEVENLASAY